MQRTRVILADDHKMILDALKNLIEPEFEVVGTFGDGHALVEGAPDLRVQGNIVDHEYAIEREGQRVAEVSKRWFRVRDTYGVEVAPGENDILVLATAAVIDTMAHPDR